MVKSMKTVFAAAALAAGMLSGSASADTVSWADLTSTDGSTFANGTITVGATNVGVSITGLGFSFVQIGAGSDTDYWIQPNPARLPYTGGSVSNAPPGTDIVAFNLGGLKTITFDQAVTDPYLALVSWNGNSGTFNQPLTVISEGQGYWGDGSFQNVTSNSFQGAGELHGIIRFSGTFNSVSFTDLEENWHGIQVGIGGLAPPPAVPEPATWGMMIAGFGLVGGALRRRPKVAVRYA